MDMFDFAGLLFGGNRNKAEATTVTATGAATSEDGVAGVTLDADVTPAEDVGEDADQTIIDLPTSPDVDEGDELIVTLVGDGPLKTPVVTANPGAGDRMRAAVTSARSVADAAQAVADAINQHFWHDSNGAHVTEATQDEWEQSPSGPNSLWNSLGMLFRDGLTNLLAIVSGTNPGVAIYDGTGNESANILASFFGSGVVIGKVGGYHLVVSSTGMHLQRGQNNLGIFSFNSNGITFAEDREHRLSLYNVLHEIVANSSGLHLYASGDPVEDSPVARIDLNATAGSTTGNGSIKFTTRVGSNEWSTPSGTILWSSGGYHMTASQTASLAQNVSTCPTGIVLHWQAYVSGSAANQDQCYCFVPKTHVASFAGGGVQMPLMTSGFGNVGCKYVYVYDDRVVGAANNNQSGAGSSITYNNAYWVLTQIIAV